MNNIYLAEIEAAIDAAGNTTLLRFASGAFTTRPTDVPANTYYDERIKQPGNVRRDMFGDGRTGGASRVSFGELVVSNMDGELDGLLGMGFDGRLMTLRIGRPGAAYPAGWPVAMLGTIEQPEFDLDEVAFRLRDRLMALDKPLLTTRYAGSNALPNGLEGVAGDLKGQLKPRAYGQVFNVSPRYVNTARYIFEIGPCTSVDAVYGRGGTVSKGADYVSQADMEANAPAPGWYRAWPAGGYFRLGSAPIGQITADVTQGATAADRSVAQILNRIALDMGIAAGDIVAGDVTALDAVNSAVVGIWIDDEQTAIDAMDAVAASIGAWYGFDRLGRLRMGRLEAPAAVAVATLTPIEILDLQRVVSQDDGRGLPTWSVELGYARNWTVQESDLDGVVAQDRRAWLAQEYRTAVASDASVKVKHREAKAMTRETLLVSQAAADAEVARLQALHGVWRDTFKATVRVDPDLVQAIDIGQTVALQYPRFGLDAGRRLVVLGMEPDYGLDQLDLVLWG